MSKNLASNLSPCPGLVRPRQGTEIRAGLLHNGKRAEQRKWEENGKNMENLPRSKMGKNGRKIPKKWKIGPIFHFSVFFGHFFPIFDRCRFSTFFSFSSHFRLSARFPLCSRPARLQDKGQKFEISGRRLHWIFLNFLRWIFSLFSRFTVQLGQETAPESWQNAEQIARFPGGEQIRSRPGKQKPKKGPKRKVHEFRPFLSILVFFLRKTSTNTPVKSS